MFLILPHSAEITYGRIPWVVSIVIALCLFVYNLQADREDAIQGELSPYCASIYDVHLDKDSTDFLRADKKLCTSYLGFIHDLPDKQRLSELMWIWSEEWEKSTKEAYTKEEVRNSIRLAMEHYHTIEPNLPSSIDAKLSYDPAAPNPFRSLLSALSHASWIHVIGNLIFFFAFAPAIEFIIGSTWRFILAMVAIELFCDAAYSVTVLVGAEPLPTLGLSGIVSGIIGMSAYLMPNVKIRTFVWIFTFAKNFHIPALFLAIWYLGWDAYDLMNREWSTGVNLVAHVSAGVAGYFIARIWFKKRREETKDDVDDEVEYRRSLRHDKLGTLSSYRSKNHHFINELSAERSKREFAQWVDHIHAAVNTNRDSVAINLILSRYEDYRQAIELYEELYQEMLNWKRSRATLCMARLLINEYLETRKYAKAIEVSKHAHEISGEFVFAEEKQRELLATIARKQGTSITF